MAKRKQNEPPQNAHGTRTKIAEETNTSESYVMRADWYAQGVDAAEEVLIPMGIKIRKDLQDGDRDYEQNFTVIYGSNMPAVLTENLFQDNVHDVEFLLSEEGKEAIVELHRRGILYFAERYLGM